MLAWLSLNSYFAPKFSSKAKSVLMSATFGTLSICTSFLAKMLDTIKGRAAFLAPLMLTCPLKCSQPVISRYFIAFSVCEFK